VLFVNEPLQPKLSSAHDPNTLLIAEDDATLLRVTSLLLRGYGYEVLAARDGQQALDVCREHQGPIDLAVLDLHMPVMNGKDAFEQMKALRPTLRAIMVTGSSDTNHPKGAEGLIHKPFEIDELVRAIRNALDSRALQT